MKNKQKLDDTAQEPTHPDFSKLKKLWQENGYTDWSKIEPHEKKFINNMVYKPVKPPLKPELRSPEIQYNPDDGRAITYKPFARTGKYTADKYNKLTSAARRKFDKNYNIFEDIPVKEEYKIPITKNKQSQKHHYSLPHYSPIFFADREAGNINLTRPEIQDLQYGVDNY